MFYYDCIILITLSDHINAFTILYYIYTHMVVNTRSMATLTEDTKVYLQELISPLVTKTDIEELEQKILKEIRGKLDDHEKRIASLENVVSNLREQVYNMETMQNENKRIISDSQNECSGLVSEIKVASKKIDNLENYSRRLCGIDSKDGETKEDIKGIIYQCFDEINVDIPIDRIYRFHRVGKPFFNKYAKKQQQDIIIKFKDWEDRCTVYKNRPRWHVINNDDSIKKPALRFSIKLELSKDRMKLLKYAINSNNAIEDSPINYIFADINCNLVCKLNNNEFKYFVNEYQFNIIQSMVLNSDITDDDNNNNT